MRRFAIKMEIERHIVRGSVADAGGNRKVIIQPYWSVLPTNGRQEGENFQGALRRNWWGSHSS